MDEKLPIYASEKKEVKTSSILIIAGLILAIVILFITGYFLLSDFKKNQSKKSNLKLSENSTPLQPEFKPQNMYTTTPEAKYPPNPDKMIHVDNFFKNLQENGKFSNYLNVIFQLEGRVFQINRNSDNNGYTIILQDAENNKLELSLTPKEVERIKVLIETTDLTKQVNLSDLKHNDWIQISGNVNLLDDSENNYTIKIISQS